MNKWKAKSISDINRMLDAELEHKNNEIKRKALQSNIDYKIQLPEGSYINDKFFKPQPKSQHTLTCECGAHVTFGKSCSVKFHSTWCPLYKNS